MKYISLTKGKRVIVDDEDYEWLNQWKWYYHKSPNGKEGYAARGIRNIKLPKGYKNIMMHRLINDTPEGFETDHINQNKLDNRRGNLRTVTRAGNRYNTGLYSSSTSGVRGVSYYKNTKKWLAHITVDRKQFRIGYFKNKEDAVKARQRAEQKCGILPSSGSQR